MILNKMGRRNELEGTQVGQTDYPYFDRLNCKIPLKDVRDLREVLVPNKMSVIRHGGFQDGAEDPTYGCFRGRYNFHHGKKIVQISSRNNV